MTDDHKTREGYLPPHTGEATIAKPAGTIRELLSPRLDVAGYETLARIHGLSYDRAARGKGLERHGNGLPFDQQPILAIARGLPFVAGLGGHAYQIQKKTQEAVKMAATGNLDGAMKELLDVSNYAAAAFKLCEEQRK